MAVGENGVILQSDKAFPEQGDLNFDNTVNLKDSDTALKILTESVPAPEVYMSDDMDGDGRIGLKDAIFIIQNHQQNN